MGYFHLFGIELASQMRENITAIFTQNIVYPV